MKKIAISILSMALLLSTVGCTSTAASSSSSKTEQTSDSISSASSSIASSEEIKEEAKNTMLLDQDGITITYVGYDSKSLLGPTVKLLIENNGDSDVMVQTDSSSIDGYVVTGMISETVPVGKKSNCTLSFFSSEFEDNGLDAEKITSVNTIFKLLDPSTYQTKYTSEEITINL